VPERAVLLNPPGPHIYLRDYFCSKVSKANYCDHPLDLLMLSGTLSRRYEVHLLDGIAERLSARGALRRLKHLAPAVIVFLAGAASWETDQPFLRRAKALTGAVMIGIADLFYQHGEESLARQPWLDAVLYDFSSDAVLDYLSGATAPLENVVYRRGGTIIGGPAVRTRGTITPALPRHDLFVNRRYTFPFIRRMPFGTLLSEYGCVYRCPFCINGLLGYKPRALGNVEAELEVLARMGVRDLWIRDQTFGASRQRAAALCRLLRRGRFGWTCYSRADVLDEALIRSMRRAGCHTIMMGVESGDDEVLARYKPGLTRRRVGQVFASCRRHGVATVASFMIGFPEEGPEEIQRTIDLALSLGCDFASFNLVVPRAGTALREQALREGLIGADEVVVDQSGTRPSMATKQLSKETLLAWRQRAERRFYCRPGYIFRRLAALRSSDELRMVLRNGLAVLRRAAHR